MAGAKNESLDAFRSSAYQKIESSRRELCRELLSFEMESELAVQRELEYRTLHQSCRENPACA